MNLFKGDVVLKDIPVQEFRLAQFFFRLILNIIQGEQNHMIKIKKYFCAVQSSPDCHQQAFEILKRSL